MNIVKKCRKIYPRFYQLIFIFRCVIFNSYYNIFFIHRFIRMESMEKEEILSVVSMVSTRTDY